MARSSFDLYYQHGWVYLTVPRGGAGSSVYPEDVRNRMRLLGMPRVSTQRLRDALDAADGSPHRLVEWPEGERLTSTMTVEIAEDAMSATVTVSAPRRGAAPPTVDDLVAALARDSVVAGVDRTAIGKLLAAGTWDTPTTVARGREPVFGRSRRVEYRFELNRGKPYLELPFGRIDLRELNFIDNRHAGDLLAVLLPPVQPEDGYTVGGTVIPAERDDSVASIPAGENTRLSSDGSELTAEIDGNVRFRDGLVIVEPVVEVDEVDYSTGNIHFDGSVVVHGHVADGFTVEATGNIQVGKGVGRATLSAGENILLTTGMNGNGDGHLSCGGNLFARYLESCAVSCHGNLFVEEAVMHSSLSVWGHVILNGRRAEIIGGDAVVGGSVWCRKLGTMYDADTRVAIGVSPEIVSAYRAARGDLDHADEEVELLEDKIHRLDRAIREGHTDERFARARAQLEEQRAAASSRADALRRNVPALRERLDPSRESIVVAEEVMYHGSVVRFGTHEYRAPQSGSWKTVLRMSHGDIHAEGFDAHDPPEISFVEATEADEADAASSGTAAG